MTRARSITPRSTTPRRTALRRSAALVGLFGALSVPVCASAALATDELPTPIPVDSMSRAEVHDICQDQGDIEYGTGASSGDYGCLNGDGTTVACDQDANCTWTPAGRPAGPTGGGKGPAGDATVDQPVGSIDPGLDPGAKGEPTAPTSPVRVSVDVVTGLRAAFGKAR